MQKYLNQGLRQQEIIKIKEAFDAFQPVNGRIETEKLRKSTEQSGNNEFINKYLQGKTTMDFDEFFQMSKGIVEEQIRKNPSLIIDTSEVQATCLFCPYAEDRPVRWLVPIMLYHYFFVFLTHLKKSKCLY